MIKKGFLFLLILFFGLGFLGEEAFAQGLINPLHATTLWDAINNLINFLVLLALAVAPILIIYAASLILSSAGRAEQIQKGKNIILCTLIALFIILLAKGLPSIVKGALGR